MSKLGIGTGITPDDGNGDSLLDGAVKINSNFNEIYSYFGDGTNLSASWQKVSSGINTTLNVGVGTTNPRFTLEVGAVGASGTSLYVNGNARVTGILTVGSSSISLDGSNNILKVGTGVTVYGNTGIVSATSFYASGMQVGVITASTIIYEGATLYNAWQETSAGINTLSNVGIGTTNPTDKLTVKGNTSLETLVVSGLSTFNGVISALQLIGDVSASDIYIADTFEVAGVSTFAGITTVTGQTLFTKQLNVSGVVTAASFVGDGSGLTNLPGGGGGGGESYWVTTAAGIHTLSNVGVGTTNPRTPLQVENVYGIKTGFGTFTASAGIAYTADSFNISSTDFKTVEYTLHVGYGATIQAQKVLAMQNGTNAYSQEYAIMYEPSAIVSVAATITSGEFRLHIIPEVGVNGLATYRLTRQSML